MQPLIQYQLVPDLELTKRLMRHTFTSLLREGCEAGNAAHSWTEAAVTRNAASRPLHCTGLPRWLGGKRIHLPMQAETQETVSIPGLERSPGGGNDNLLQYSCLAGKIPWTEEPGRLQSMGLQRVGRDWAHNTHTALDMLEGKRWTWSGHELLSHRAAAASIPNYLL